MSPPVAARSDRLRSALLGVETVAAFLAIGIPIALSVRGPLPEPVLLLAFPAFVATFLVDTFLFNAFLIETGPLIYVILAVSVYLQAVAVGATIRWIRARLAG